MKKEITAAILISIATIIAAIIVSYGPSENNSDDNRENTVKNNENNALITGDKSININVLHSNQTENRISVDK